MGRSNSLTPITDAEEWDVNDWRDATEKMVVDSKIARGLELRIRELELELKEAMERNE